jgi:hypothetical protein
MKESKLQSEMVIDFSQLRPHERGQLWSTANRSLSLKDGQKQKAMGMFPGVSDLIYYSGVLNGIEVKAPGSKHSRNHIQSQYDWGCMVESLGGTYHIATSLHSFWAIINGKYNSKGVYSLQDIKSLLDMGKGSIVF